jgi:hypothetical protein
VTAKQFRDLWRLQDQVDIAVTDSPLLLGLVYGREDVWPDSYYSWVIDQFNTFDNLNFMLVRTKPYLKVGRSQTHEEAKVLDQEISQILLDTDIPHTIIGKSGKENEKVDEILKILEKELTKTKFSV